tara:strand:- start:8133 stop:8732 length:600 start_codon:yes stop_codon:yes gene_type:complete
MAQRSRANIFGSAAPSPNLKLPEDLVILVSEIVVYFPNHIRNYDVLLRLVQAGVTQMTITNLVNLHRLIPTNKFPVLPNSVCKIIEKEMRIHSGFGKWTMGKHKNGSYTYDYDWDSEDLTLNGVRLDCELHPEYSEAGEVTNPPIEGIPFADLAVDINAHPSYARGDGFIFTRCVQYVALHPQRGYVFPRDFAYLAEKL